MEKNSTEEKNLGRRPPIHKRKFVINPRLQWELILFFYGACIITLATVYLGTNHLMGQISSRCALFGFESSCLELISLQKNTINMLFLYSLVIATIVSVCGGLFFSNRIAGPIYRFVRNLKQIGEGRIRKITIRKNDYFHEVASLYNENIVEKFGPQINKNE